MANQIQIVQAIGKWPAQFNMGVSVYSAEKDEPVRNYTVTIDHSDTVDVLRHKVAAVAELNIEQIKQMTVKPIERTERIMTLYSIAEHSIAQFKQNEALVIDCFSAKFAMRRSEGLETDVMTTFLYDGTRMVDFGQYIKPYSIICVYTPLEQKF